MVSGILLAAGLSSRMGQKNKLLLPFKGHSLFVNVLNALLDSDLDELIVVLGHDYQAMIPHLKDRRIKIAINEKYKLGQTSSIIAGVQLVDPETDAYMICLSDMPYLKTNHINKLLDYYNAILESKAILRPMKDKIPGNPIIFSKFYYSEIMNCKASNGCRKVVEENKEHLVNFNTDSIAYFKDIDTKEEYLEIIGND